MNEKEIIEIAKGLYPKYIKDAKECVNHIIDTFIKIEKTNPREIGKIGRLYGISREEFVDLIVEKLKGDKK